MMRPKHALLGIQARGQGAWRARSAWIGIGLALVLLAHCAWMPARNPMAVPAGDFNALFQRTGGGWTGGDGTQSVPLPDGRTVWFFGDTLLGTVSADGTRPADTPMIRNCLVVQDHQALTTLFSAGPGPPAAFFNPPVGQTWFWPGAGTVQNDQLLVFLHQFEQQEAGLWSWRWTGTFLAALDLPTLTWTVTRPAPGENEVVYGVCLLESGPYLYIYGTADHDLPKQAHVARAPTNHLNGPWQYCGAQGWRAAQTDSSPMLAGVSTQYSVIERHGNFYLFTMDGRAPFSSTLVVYRSAAPAGPWQGPVTLYAAPEAGPDIVAYNPFAHLQFSDQHQVLVSYNLNHIRDPGALYRDAGIYRPRFVRVDIRAVDQRFDIMAGAARQPE